MPTGIVILPEESLMNVFVYLEAKDLTNSAKVCKLWARLASDKMLWENLFPELLEVKLEELTLKEFILDAKQVLNFNDLELRIKKIVDKVQLGTMCHISCIFAFDPTSFFKLNFGDTQASTECNFEQQFTFLKPLPANPLQSSVPKLIPGGNEKIQSTLTMNFPHWNSADRSDFEQRVIDIINPRMLVLQRQDKERHDSWNRKVNIVVALSGIALFWLYQKNMQ